MQDKMENWAEGERKGGPEPSMIRNMLKGSQRKFQLRGKRPDVLHLQKSQLSHPA